MSLADLEQMTVAEFVEQYSLDQGLARDNLPGLVRDYLAAWNSLCSHVLRDSPRDEPDMVKFCDSAEGPAVSEHGAPAIFLFPCGRGPGVCATNLVRFMIQEHNALASPELPIIQHESITEGEF